MIREPYNINPYNQTKDLTNNPSFSFTYGGDALIGYDLRIIDNGNKNNVIRDWICAGSSYNQILFEDKIYNDRTEIEDPIYQPYIYADASTLYNDESFSFSLPSSLIIQNSLFNNKGIIWQLRLFEDNKNPTNLIQYGDINEILSVLDEGENSSCKLKGTITGLLEQSDESIFKNGQNYEEDTWINQSGEQVEGYKPLCWTRNVMKVNDVLYPVTDYETHMEQFFTTSKPDTYFLGELKEDASPTFLNCSKIQKVIKIHNYSTGLDDTLYSAFQSRDDYKYNNLIASSSSDIGNIFSLSDYFTSEELKNSTFDSIKYFLGPQGASCSTLQIFNPEENNFETTTTYSPIFIKSVTTTQEGKEKIELIKGTRENLGLSKTIVLWNGQSVKESTETLTEEEYSTLGTEKALASTSFEKSDEKEYGIYDESSISFNETDEQIIYTVEKDDEVIHYNKTSQYLSVDMTREQAYKENIITDEKKSLIIKSSTDDSIETSDKYFTYDEVSNFKDNDYGVYTIGCGLSEDRTSKVPVTEKFPQKGVLEQGKEIYFNIFNNYYDSNFYYFTHQIQPDIYYNVNCPYYTYKEYLRYKEENNGANPTETIGGVENYFQYQRDGSVSKLILDFTIGSEDNPLVLLQRYCTISSSTAGYPYNFKYYNYKIFGGHKTEENISYDIDPLFISDKIFSRSITIDYNNYVTDYDIYKIELTLTTSENGIYYYYTYFVPSIDMFQDDEDDARFSLVEYDDERGAAKISWVKDNAYPAVYKYIEKATYGTYKSNGKLFTLNAWSTPRDGYISYYHKGGEILNISPLHDFQISFTLDHVLQGLDTLTINPLVAFYGDNGALIIQLQLVNNKFKVTERGIGTNEMTLIEVKDSLVSLDNGDGVNKNQIYQYKLPKTGNLPKAGNLAAAEQDLKKYCFHFYLFPYTIQGGEEASTAKISYRLNRFYNANSEATNDLILYQYGDIKEWQLGFYGEGAGYNAEFDENSGSLTSGPNSNNSNFDTSEYLSKTAILGGIRNADQNFDGLSRINLYGPALYYGIFDVNRRGTIASEDNFILNFNESLSGSSTINRIVKGYRIFRNVYENDNLNRRDAAMKFCVDLESYFQIICSNITKLNKDPITSYDMIVDGENYANGWENDNETPVEIISGKQLKEKINSSFDNLRKEISIYYSKWDVNFGLNPLNDDFDVLYKGLQEIQKPEIVSSEMIADLDIENNSITEKDGFYIVYDYNVPNCGYFRYQVVPMLENQTYNVLIAKINDYGESILKVSDENWHMTNLSKRKDNSYQPVDTWTFLLGVQTATYTQNFVKTIQTGFGHYPKVMTSLSNYKTTSFNGYLGKFKYGENGMANTYEDDINLIEKWNSFAYNNNQILVKDPKGHVFIATISSTQDSSDAAIGEMPTQLSCTLTQIGDVSQFKVYTM